MEPTTRTKAATLRDVARVAGVSHQTVSRVINDHPNITPRTRERVERAMAELSYRPNRVARALATARSRTIGILSTDNGRYGPPKTQRAIERAAREAGYFISTVNLAHVGHESMQNAIVHLVDQGIDGLVVIAPQSAMLDAFTEFRLSLPYVTVDSAGRGGGHTIAIDQALGARLATAHLVGLGHTRIAHLAGPTDWLDSQARIRGWREVLAASGLDVIEPLHGDWSPADGYAAALTLARDTDATAVFVSNDQMALGMLRGLEALGLSVPGDMSLVGFDDVPEAAYYSPPLTTVRPDFSELGRQCLGLLLGQLDGDDVEAGGPIPPDLVVRDSTSAPRP